MNIAVLSGKGGTGKTTVSTNLAIAMNANYIDCDVEEPNGFIFLKPDNIKKRDVLTEYPFIVEEKCSLCGKCVNACQFNALAKVKEDIILFEKICHSCGACEVACDKDAITFKKRKVGIVEEGNYKNLKCVRGLLDIGEPMAVPVIRNVLDSIPEGTNIVDCSPGTSCNVVNSLKYVDGAVLVTEPTKFGLHDLNMAVQLVKKFNIPFGIVINKSNSDEKNEVIDYCMENNIKILAHIPYSKDVAKIYSRGHMLYDTEKYKNMFDKIVFDIKDVLPWK